MDLVNSSTPCELHDFSWFEIKIYVTQVWMNAWRAEGPPRLVGKGREVWIQQWREECWL